MIGSPLMDDEQRRFMEVDIQDGDDRGRFDEASLYGAPALLVQVVNTQTSPNVFYLCRIVEVLGTEIEGGQFTATTTGTGGTLLVANLGTSAITAGTYLIAVRVPERWVCVYTG